MFDAYVLRADEIPDDLRAVIPYWRAEGGEFWAGPPQSGQKPVTGGDEVCFASRRKGQRPCSVGELW